MTRVVSRESQWPMALLVLCLAAAPAGAIPIFQVDSTLDQVDDDASDGICHTAAGTCTLRAAVMQANQITGVGATILLPPGTYTLTRPASGPDGDDNGDLNLTTPASGSPLISILGSGAAVTIIDANQIDRVFSVEIFRSVAISGVTITHGFTVDLGGGILDAGSLQLDHVKLIANSAGSGGGIRQTPSSGGLILTDCVVSGNQAMGGQGGGINSSSSLYVARSTISGNGASSFGGAIVSSFYARVSSSTLSLNSADIGGAVANSATLLLLDSTVDGNTASKWGGGVYNQSGGTANANNTTFVSNEANSGGVDGLGGGVYNSGGFFGLRNDLFAANYRPGPVYDDCGGTVSSYGRNLFWSVPGTCTVSVQSGSWTTLNSLATIGPLADNGGPTWTRALLAGCNAIDGGDPVDGCIDDMGLIATDQRGAPRVAGTVCDVGAYEYASIVTDIFSDGFEAGSTEAWNF